MYLVPGISLVDVIVCGCTACCVAACDVDWYLLSLVDAILRGCTCCVAVYDLLTDTGTA